ncbi:MAG: tetratricopeptide repeat protein [Terriglobales bacterium]
MNDWLSKLLLDLGERYVVELVVIATTALFSLVYWLFRGRLKSKEAQIRRLKEDLERRELELGTMEREMKSWQQRCECAERQLPRLTLQKVEDELHENNDGPANRAAVDWFEQEGHAISMLLFHRAQWVIARAAGNIRAFGLTAAEGYATAAIVVCPQNTEARELLVDLEALRCAERQSLPPIVQALTSFDAQAGELFDSGLASAADIAEGEAFSRYGASRFLAALPIVDLLLNLRLQTVGKTSAMTLRARSLKAAILTNLGHGREALSIAERVADAQAAHPDLGPNHRETLDSRFLVAQILHRQLGRSGEALPIARSVADANAADLGLGPHHQITLASRYLVAQILNRLGYNVEALVVAQSVLELQIANPGFGPKHRVTLSSRFLVAQILRGLGRYQEALSIAQNVADVYTAHPDLGPNNRETLTCRHYVAQMLQDLGRNQEALSIAQSVLDARAIHEELEPNHHEVLGTRFLVAQILNTLGRNQEALPLAQSVVEASATNPDLTPNHPQTLVSRLLLAEILRDLGRNQEALPLAQSVADALAADPNFGPNHRETLASRQLVRQILEGLQGPDDAGPSAK